MNKKAIVVHSGGMDSSICLALACREFGHENVLSLSFSYHQRHQQELVQAKKICAVWNVDHYCLEINCLKEITQNALMDKNVELVNDSKELNSLVVGRNGLMAHIAGIHAENIKAHCIYLGVMELEEANSGYRDCSRTYMDLQEQILRIDLNQPQFEIRTPLIYLTKKQTMEVAADLGILEFLLNETITCYEGIIGLGCNKCASCILRNRGLREFISENPSFSPPYSLI